jgi:hypothetical protein
MKRVNIFKEECVIGRVRQNVNYFMVRLVDSRCFALDKNAGVVPMVGDTVTINFRTTIED